MNEYTTIISNQNQTTVFFQKTLLVLTVSLGLNFVPNIIFPYFDVAPYAGVTFFLFLYLVSRGLNNVLNTFYIFYQANKRFRVIILPIYFLFLFELFRFPINPGISIYMFVILPILLFVFFLFIIDIYTNFCNNQIQIFLDKYVNSYFKLCNIIVILSGIIFILIKIGAVDLNQWNDISLYGNDFKVRQEYLSGEAFVNPFYITVISPFFVKSANFFGEYGTFCGWSYEPHVACFLLTPAFLMINYFEKNRIKKYLLIASYLLFYLLSLSLTAIIGLLIVLLVYVIGLKNRSAKQKLFIIFSFLVFSFSIPLIYEYFSDEILYSQDKFESQTTDSSSYGVTFNYIFSPSTFFGDGLLKAPNGGDVSFSTGESSTTNSLDIGIIPFINFLWFYSVIIFFSFHTSFKNKEFGFIGLILIYIIFHSMKFPFHVFHYPIVFLFYFILSVVPKDSEIIT